MVDLGDDDWWQVGTLTPDPGGEWWGVLFENPAMAIPPTLTWGFTFPFVSVTDDGAELPLALTVEYVRPPARSWRQLGGHQLTSTGFTGLAEATVHHYLHHRFETIDIRMIEQRDRELRVAATVSGDADRLGVDPLVADAWLTFAGVTVSLPGAATPDLALARLGEFTDTAELMLEPAWTGGVLSFVPADLPRDR